MATISKLKKRNGDIILPVTRVEAVVLTDGVTNLDTKLTNIDSNISTNASNIATNTSGISALSSTKAPLASPAFTGSPSIDGVNINSTTVNKALATASWVADGSYWKYAIPITERVIATTTKVELLPLERSTFGTVDLFKTYLDLIQNANMQGESITATSGGTGYVNVIAMGTKPASDVTITLVIRGD